jgi:hypothetical protein
LADIADMRSVLAPVPLVVARDLPPLPPLLSIDMDGLYLTESGDSLRLDGYWSA